MNNDQKEITADMIVIEQYAIETANLKLQNAQLRIKLNEQSKQLEELKESDKEG